jgi:hypothetical protein
LPGWTFGTGSQLRTSPPRLPTPSFAIIPAAFLGSGAGDEGEDRLADVLGQGLPRRNHAGKVGVGFLT